MSISLGLAENYAMLGSKYLYMYNAGDVKGFMGSNFLSYPPVPNADSNGIVVGNGSIPNAPIVNGAAALQAIADVTTAVDIMDDFKDGGSYNGIPINVPIIAAGDQVLNNILTAPKNDYINVYKITGNLTMSAPVDFTVNASTVCIFIVGGDIEIDLNISRTGGILPQNIIFIANGHINIGTSVNSVTVSGIYISTGSSANIEGNRFTESKLTGRLISTSINNGFVNIDKSSITAP